MTRLFQSWRDHDVPAQLQRYRFTWLEHDARLAPVLLDDVACRQWVEDCEPALLPIYDALPASIMRADMWRYVVLLHAGGIYADLDVECTGPVDVLLGPGVHLVTEDLRRGRFTVSNAVMASSEPGHPFWRYVLEELVRRAKAVDCRPMGFAELAPHHQRGVVLRVTGPYMLTDALESYGGPGLITVHEKAKVPVVHHRAGTWWR